MLDRFAWLVDGLVVDTERMRANLDASRGLVFSQRVLSALVAAGHERDDSYRLVQRRACGRRKRFSRVHRVRLGRGSRCGCACRSVRPRGRASPRRRPVRPARSAPPTTRGGRMPEATHVASGKVRETTSSRPTALLVASDRISTFDVVLPTEIPDKGRVLTGLSGFGSRALSTSSRTTWSSSGRTDARRRHESSTCSRSSASCAATSPARGGATTTGDRRDLRPHAARRSARVRPAARTDLHAGHEGEDGSRREHRARAGRRACRRRAARRGRARDRPLPVRGGARGRARHRYRGHQVRARSGRVGAARTRRRGADARPPASGPPTSTSPAARRPPSASSTSATTARRSAGARRRPAPSFLTRSWRARANGVRRGLRAPGRASRSTHTPPIQPRCCGEGDGSRPPEEGDPRPSG